ncbi:MAG TPA: long-chain fatty acid--CoA ligase [Clostridia bacterium]|nr:long-chain fatty acid--CoA ligase [Clostridia bacterium]
MKQKPRTLNDIFYAVVERDCERVMVTRENGAWRSISSSEFYKSVVGAAHALQSWGVGRGDRIAILSENRPEWAIADFATLLIGAAVVPIYSTLTGEQAAYLLRHSGARIAFVSTQAQLEKLEAIRSQTHIDRIIAMDDLPLRPGLELMSPMMAAGPSARDAQFDALAHTVTRDDLATVIYTSGTTGVPKGAMLTHGNLASNLEVSLDAFAFEPGNVGISFLPLSHITARHLDYAMFFHSITIAYCPFMDDLGRTLNEIHPTVFVAVPRVYEKIYNQVEKEVGHGLKRKLYNWTLRVGEAHRDEILAGLRPASFAWKLADKLVYGKVRAAMGGRVHVFISGGAPLGRELGEWYAKIGIRINEGYGLTETSPVISINHPSGYKLGTVGKPLPNLEIRIAGDGEILVRGPSIFKGYWNMPEETSNAFDGDWFKTGDIGMLDSEGFLSITDRKKDLIKTSGGKFVAPQPIENSLKANVLISEAAVIGDRRRFASVVLAPSFVHLEDWARHNGVEFSTREELISLPKIQALYEGIVADINCNLAQYEKLKRVLVIPEELSVANGTLTPTLKLRRRMVEERYRKEIERLYADASSSAPEPATITT